MFFSLSFSSFSFSVSLEITSRVTLILSPAAFSFSCIRLRTPALAATAAAVTAVLVEAAVTAVVVEAAAGVVVAVGVELFGIGIGIVLVTLADRELEPLLESGTEPELGEEPELELEFGMELELEVELDLEAVSERFLMSGASSPLSGERR